ncbi:MAG: hypothetical protein MHM6MM_001388 [Cercozoa sp. M6MM]
MERVSKATNRRAKRALKQRAPLTKENTKRALVLKGHKTSDIVQNAVKDMFMLKKPDAMLLQRRNDVRPFESEGQARLESMCRKHDASLFCLGAHAKKRPHALTLGRMFDFQVLDMFELLIDPDTFRSAQSLGASRNAVAHVGSKPAVLFQGDFETNEHMRALRSLMLDLLRGAEVDKINVAGVTRVVVCTALPGKKLLLRHYAVVYNTKEDGASGPAVALEEIGPRMDLSLRRVHRADEEMQRAARRVPKQLKQKKVKNVSFDELRGKVGQVHMQRQDLEERTFHKFKTAKKRRQPGDD